MADTTWNSDPGAVGAAMPIVPSVPQDFIDDYKRAMYGNAFIKQQGGGLLPGLIRMIAGINPADIASAYNGTLTGAQGAEQGRLTTQYYDQANGVGGQPAAAPAPQAQPQAAPAVAPGAGLVAAMGGPDGQMGPGTVAPPSQAGLVSALSGNAAPPSIPGMRGPMPSAAGGWGPNQILAGLRTAAMVPGLAKNMPAYITALDTAIKEGKSIGPDGSIYNTPGALPASTLSANAAKGISMAGVDPNNPNAVNRAVAAQAGATKSAEGWAGVGPANAISDHSAGNTLVTNLAKPNDLRENGALVVPPQPVLTANGWRFPSPPLNLGVAGTSSADGSPQSKGDSNVSIETMPDGTRTITNSGTVREATQNNEKLYQDFQGLATANKGAEQNIKNAANAFQYFASGAGTEASADAAAWMKRAGIDPKAFNLADPAQVQIAKKAVVQAIFSQMSGIQNPALGEFQLAEKAAGQPDFQPDAVKAIFGTTLGKMALQDDFFQNMAQHRNEKGTMRGYDPSKFLLSADAQGYQQQAEKTLPWFKGETGAPPYTKLAAPPTDADIASTALKYNMTPNQVRAKLGLPALGGGTK